VHRVFVDSNVLGSRTQYDWLFMLRNACGLFAVVTSDDVLDEAYRVWRRKHPAAGSELRSQRAAHFAANFDEVLDVWEGGEAPTLKDEHDTHVHNAANAADVDILLTNNVADFGDPGLLPYDLYTPDQFFVLINQNKPEAVREVTRAQAKYWHARNQREKDREPIRLADALRRAGCPTFADEVSIHLRVLADAESRSEPRSGNPSSSVSSLPEEVVGEQVSG
jgi:hypothetical protein